MKKMFWGLIFICLNLNLHQYIAVCPNFDFLPDFIGYFLLLLGVKELGPRSPRLEKLAALLGISMVLSFVESVLMFLGNEGIFVTLLAFALLVMELYILHQVASAYEEFGSVHQWGQKMHKYWGMLFYLPIITVIVTMSSAFLSGLGYIVAMIGVVAIFGLGIALLVYRILYLVAAYHAANEYVPDEVVRIETENEEEHHDS